MRGRERQNWLIQLANREGAWPKRPYECFWSKVGVSIANKLIILTVLLVSLVDFMDVQKK